MYKRQRISVPEFTCWFVVDIGLDHKPASELWDRYPEMFQGAYPLDKSLVAKETTRYSKGSFEKAERILGWRPHTDMESLVKKVTLEIE